MTTTKRYTVTAFDKPPKGALRRFTHIDAVNKSDLKKQVETFNKESKDEYISLRSAFVLP